MPTAAEIITRLELRPHPEGGHYRETFRDQTTDANGRSRSTLIYFLLARGERSHWHRIDAVETWHYYAGSPLTLRIAHDGCSQHEVRLGTDLLNGERPQAIVPADAWQMAETTGEWTLVGCTVAPAFEFAKFELAPKGWEPELHTVLHARRRRAGSRSSTPSFRGAAQTANPESISPPSTRINGFRVRTSCAPESQSP